jgi:hypothetical protein
MCCSQNAVKSKIKSNFINPIVDKMPYDLIHSGASSNNNIKINVSSLIIFINKNNLFRPQLFTFVVTNAEQDLSQSKKNLNSINYPREILLNLKSADGSDSDKSISFIYFFCIITIFKYTNFNRTKFYSLQSKRFRSK